MFDQSVFDISSALEVAALRNVEFEPSYAKNSGVNPSIFGADFREETSSLGEVSRVEFII